MSNTPMKTSRFSGGPHDQMKTTSVASMLSCTEVVEERGGGRGKGERRRERELGREKQREGERRR